MTNVGHPPAALDHLDPAGYRPHPLHDDERAWSETNCYSDLWIELLHALGVEPLAMAAFTVAADFEGAQWAFFKPPLEDLLLVYGIRVGEMNVWRAVPDHIVRVLNRGQLLTVDVDAWYLPDTVGSSYHTAHVKTSVVPVSIDRAARTMTYFHARGYHTLSGADFDGITAPQDLPPYIELIRIPPLLPEPGAVVAASRRCLTRHVELLPPTNPIERLAVAVAAELPALAGADPETFHAWAFGTLRQCGSCAELASSYLGWLEGATGLELGPAAAAFAEISTGAKSAQFTLARAVRGRPVDLPGTLGGMAEAWDRAARHLRAHVLPPPAALEAVTLPVS